MSECATCNDRRLVGGLLPAPCLDCGPSNRVRRLATLAHNLTIAAGLTRSFHLGENAAISERNLGDAYEADMLSLEQYKAGFAKIWDPGCGKEAP